MTAILLTKVEPKGEDVLVVSGYINGEFVAATGWQSALTNHYEPSVYGDDGHRDPDTKARVMTPDEARAYCEGLLLAAAPASPSTQPLPVAIRLDQPLDPS